MSASASASKSPLSPLLGEYLGCSPDDIQSALARQSASDDSLEKKRIGQLLRESGVISSAQLESALRAQRITRLGRCTLFAELSPDDLDSVCGNFSELSVPAGETFIHQDHWHPYLYLIVSGQVEVFQVDENNGQMTPLALRDPGEHIGEMGYASQTSSSASVRALVRSELLRVHYDDLTTCIEQVPGLAKIFWRVASDRLRQVGVLYQDGHHRQMVAERSLQHLYRFLHLAESKKLGSGIEGLIENLVFSASRLMNAERATLFLIDDTTGELWSKVAEGSEIREIRIPGDRGVAGWVARKLKLVNIKDAYQDDRFNQDIDRQTGYRTRTILCGPIINYQNKLLGVVQVINKRADVFDDDDERLFQIFSHQAAIAVDNFNLYNRMAASHKKIAAMLEIAVTLSETLRVEILIRKIVTKIPEVLECDRSSFFVLDSKTDELWSMEAHGYSLKEIRFPTSAGLAGHAARTNEIVNIADAYEDPRFNPEFDKMTGYRTRSVLCVPVHDRDGNISGVTQAINKVNGNFDADDVELLRAISAQIGVALQNAQLHARTVEMKNYLESVQESISNSLITLDCDRKVVTANEAAVSIFQSTIDAMLNVDIRDLFGPRNEQLMTSVEKVYENRENVIEYDAVLVNPSGVESSININALPLHDGDDEFRGVVLILEDITKEKRIKSTLIRYMSKDIVDRMLQDPTQQALGGMRSMATVLFSDIRGFTTIAEGMTAEQIMDFLNDYFTLMVDEVLEQRGVLDKFMGDGLLAVFGVPFPQNDDSVRAIHAALGMIRSLDAFNAGRMACGQPPVRIGVGMNTDEVISGNMGSQKRMEYTVIGDGVNLASRIEGLNKYYGTSVLISESTRERIDDEFVIRHIDTVIAKGKSLPVRIYEVLGTRGHALSAHHEQFMEGLERYKKREFNEALAFFQRGAGDDGPCRTYLERCRHYLSEPPPDDWDGIWRSTAK